MQRAPSFRAQYAQHTLQRPPQPRVVATAVQQMGLPLVDGWWHEGLTLFPTQVLTWVELACAACANLQKTMGPEHTKNTNA